MLHSTVSASFNGRFLTDYGTSDIEYIYPYYFDKLCIIAPKALKIPKWIAIFRCFSGTVWIILFLIICFCGLFWFFLKRPEIVFPSKQVMAIEKRNSSNLFQNVFIGTWIMMLSGSIPHLPSHLTERIFVAVCLFSSIIIVGTFQVIKVHKRMEKMRIYVEIELFSFRERYTALIALNHITKT